MGRRSGCLGGLVILALAGLVLSLLLPFAAGGLVELGLTAAGLRAEHLVVRVEADPPLRLLLGRADRVVVEGSGITWNGTTAASLALVAVDVDLLGRHADTVGGRLSNVRLAAGPAGALTVTELEIEGPGSGPDARLRIAAAEARRAVEALAAALGVGVVRVALEPPDRVVVGIAGQRLAARIAVVEGSVVVNGPGLPSIVVLGAKAVRGLVLRSVAVEADGGLLVEGRLDPGLLGLAP